MAATVTAADLRDLAPAALRAPHALYDAWRAQGPVVRVPELGGWVVSDFATALAIVHDHEQWSSDRFDGPRPAAHQAWLAELAVESPELEELLAVPLQTLVALDPPDHGRLRRVLVPLFSATAIRRLEPLVCEQVDRLLAALPDEPFDFVAAYGDVLPFAVVALLFGLPESEWPEFRRLAMEANSDNPQRETKERLRARLTAELALMRYFAARIRAPDPGVDPEGLLACLHEAVADGTISVREATGLCREVLVAGADSTGNHLAMALLALAERPELLAKLHADPALVEPFVEELLRLEPPFKGFWRRATGDTVVGGAAVPRDGLVLLSYQALNRDPGVYADPHSIVLDRPTPKRHLTFGNGIHFCLGAPLARLQSTTTFGRIVASAEAIELARPAAALEPRPSLQIGGVESLPVRLRGR